MSLLELLKEARKESGSITNLVNLTAKHNVDHNVASVLKGTGMVERNQNGAWEWKDGKVTSQMVDEVRELSNELSGPNRRSITDILGL